MRLFQPATETVSECENERENKAHQNTWTPIWQTIYSELGEQMKRMVQVANRKKEKEIKMCQNEEMSWATKKIIRTMLNILCDAKSKRNVLIVV